MATIEQPDILGSFIGGMNAARQKRQSDLMEYKQKLLADLAPRALAGDTGALNQLGSVDPETAVRVGTYIAGQNKIRDEQMKEFVTTGVHSLAAVANDPQKFEQVKMGLVQHPLFAQTKIDPNQITPQTVLQLQAQLGVAPEQPKFEKVSPGDTYGIYGPNGIFTPQGVAPKPQIGNVPPPEFTPASLEKFNKSGNYADLVPIPKPTTQGGGTYGVAGLTPEENMALFGPNGAVPTGKLNPDKINSRTAKFLAQAFLLNPDQDMNRLASEGSMMRNSAFMNRAITVETLPDIMKNMVDAGKKVGFSDIKIIGRLQKWSKGELNDPALTEYMTIRNDALMNIASAMRGAGMSDKAHEAEIEAASPSMSPAALDAWLKGQMETLRPRLKRMERYTRPGGRLPDQPTPSGGGVAPASGTEDPLGIR